jgi:hypothetical protein
VVALCCVAASAQPAEALLAAVDAWAGVASYAVVAFYAPASPWRREAGWGEAAVKRLRAIADALADALRIAASVLKALSWTVSVGFPWGVSVGLTWSP